MERKTQVEDEAAAQAKAKREARMHAIFGAIAAIVITGLIAVMFFIEDYGERVMPGAQVKVHDAADDH
jgi:hypothetical protein